ncbi:hypothetical protein Back11_32200 [Paenibacillus baekrokdamisoli]|uniref:Uncharacterized protein n=1 Tax=Paenibacillus baekrokdamisoli TaxID=1712516 RepID=A0A3G9J0J4_9BACL|nr:cupredoxin domain-containing protein [Paenibacillus baekrokdamisoli]MBB3071615.1 cytochrome c oxidase subunit 2 [Paenibacillus baekrokdamisoli]BBH21875.1 hypothetical protein Back11_32200 [Paenibacillus baekrokdamisoli]
MKIRTGILFLMLILIAALASACGSSSTSDTANTANATSTTSAADSSATGKTVEIKLGAKDFEYDQKEIHVKKGNHVKITLTSDDGGHGFTIPDYNVDIQGNKSAEFDAKNAGTFEYHCSVMCGTGHTQMKGKLIVDEA